MADKTIDQLVADMNKQFKKKIITVGNELKKFEFIPFTSPKLNYLTRGGVPEGKMSMFVGVSQGGKTTTALDVLANYQKKYPERYAVYLDAENTLNVEWGEMLGVDWSKVILIKPEHEHGEELLDMVLAFIKSGDVGLSIIDSVPFLIPKAQYEEDLEKKSMGGNSALITQFCNRVIPVMNKNNCTVIMINQVRDKFGVTYTAYNYPGGRQLYHSCVEVIVFSRGAYLDQKGAEVSTSCENPMGNVVNIKMDKNKATKNDRRIGTYTLNYSRGVDVLRDTVEMAIFTDVVRQSGAWCYMVDFITGEELKFNGKAKLIEHLLENVELFNLLVEQVNNAVI